MKDPIIDIGRIIGSLTGFTIGALIILNMLSAVNASPTGIVTNKYYTDNAFNTYCMITVESTTKIFGFETINRQKIAVPHEKFLDIQIEDKVNTAMANNPIKAVCGIRQLIEEE